MRYLIIVVGDAELSEKRSEEVGQSLFGAFKKYNDDLKKSGVLLSGEALTPVTKAARVRVEEGRRKVLDGPFSEAKEFVGGYFLIQVKSREEALEWAARCPAASLGGNNCVELREVLDIPA
jgi:hypothetical protein